MPTKPPGESISTKALAAKREGDQGGVIEFGRTANVDEAPVGKPCRTLEAGDADSRGRTPPICPAPCGWRKPPCRKEFGHKIVVLSDGNEKHWRRGKPRLTACGPKASRVDVCAPTALGFGDQRDAERRSDGGRRETCRPAPGRIKPFYSPRPVVSSTVAQPCEAHADPWTGQPLGPDARAASSGQKMRFTFPRKPCMTPGFSQSMPPCFPPLKTLLPRNNQGFGFRLGVPAGRAFFTSPIPSTRRWHLLKNALNAQQIDLDVQDARRHPGFGFPRWRRMTAVRAVRCPPPRSLARRR